MVKDRAGRGVSDANDAHRPGAVCLRLPSGSKVAAGRPMTSAQLPLLGRAAVGEGDFPPARRKGENGCRSQKLHKSKGTSRFLL